MTINKTNKLKNQVDDINITDRPIITKTKTGLILHLGFDDLPEGTRLYATPEIKKKVVAWMYILCNDKGEQINKEVSLYEYNLDITSPFGRERIDYAAGAKVCAIPLYSTQAIEAALKDKNK